MDDAPTGDDTVILEAWGDTHRTRIENSHAEGGVIGVSIANGSTLGIIAGCTVLDQSFVGLEIAGSTHCAVDGNTVDLNGNGTLGITVDTDAQYCVVSANAIKGMSDALGSSGIYVRNGSHHVSVTGNNIDAESVSTAAIRIEASDHASVTGNTCDGQTTGSRGIVIANSSDIAVTGDRKSTRLKS